MSDFGHRVVTFTAIVMHFAGFKGHGLIQVLAAGWAIFYHTPEGFAPAFASHTTFTLEPIV